MNDEQQVRSLLTVAAELSDDVQPSVRRLIEQGQSRRIRRIVAAALTTAAVVLAAVLIQSVIWSPVVGSFAPSYVTIPGLFAGQPPPGETGPTASQISKFIWANRGRSPLGARSQPILAWTGGELLEIGGLTGTRAHNDGAAYSFLTGSWRRIASAPGVVGATAGSSIWTGHELFVVGGRISPSTDSLVGPWAGLYNPSDNRWTATLLPSQMAGLNVMAVTWTGRDVIVAGTNTTGQQLGVAAYNPRTNGWQLITPGLPSDHPARYVSLVATTDRIILWSLWDRAKTYANGASDYAGVDVLALGEDGTWRDVTGRWPQEQNVTSPIFTGRKILVSPGQIWCGQICIPPYTWNRGSFADPATLHRSDVPLGPLGQANPAFIWTGREIIAVDLTGSSGGPQGPVLRPDDTAMWDPAGARWSRLPAPPGFPALAATPVWTGSELLELASNGMLLSFMHNCC